MRVLHVTPTFFDKERSLVGGGERFVSELAKAMSKKAETSILTWGAREERLHVDGVDIQIRRPLARRGDPLGFIPGGMPEIAKADVVHIHQPYTWMGGAAILRASRKGKPIFLTDLGGGSFNVHERLALDRKVTAHLCISQFASEFLRAPVAPRVLIYAGIDPAKFHPGPRERERRVVCVGRITPHKGQADVIRAIPPDVPLDIYGPVLHPEYLALCERSAEGKQVRFIHDASTDEIVEAYRHAMLTVQASVLVTEYGEPAPNTELFGLTVAESMGCETPPIATRAGALPEVVEDGVTGLVVAPSAPSELRAAMVRLLDDPVAAREMGRRGRQRVLERFTWDAVAESCLAQYSLHLRK